MTLEEIYVILGARSRRKRLQLLVPLLIKGVDTSLVDIGGTPEFWLRAGHIAHITIVNIARPASVDELPNWMEFRLASGTALPFADDSFDVAFSDSAIEHLGSLAAQRCRHRAKGVNFQSSQRGQLWTVIDSGDGLRAASHSGHGSRILHNGTPTRWSTRSAC